MYDFQIVRACYHTIKEMGISLDDFRQGLKSLDVKPHEGGFDSVDLINYRKRVCELRPAVAVHTSPRGRSTFYCAERLISEALTNLEGT